MHGALERLLANKADILVLDLRFPLPEERNVNDNENWPYPTQRDGPFSLQYFHLLDQIIMKIPPNNRS